METAELAPLQHEEEETFELRTLYEQALSESYPEIDASTARVIALMVVKKARYGVIYEEAVENLINEVNIRIIEYYKV